MEEELADIQEVRGSIPCKDGDCSKRLNVVQFCEFTAYSSGELI